MFTNEELMLRCIRLAEKGRGSVSPNPMVGCVIVKDGRIIGEGYHQKFGQAHAEVNAVNSATEDVEGAEVFVNLEPCSFFGKTPPCADLLIKRRVKIVHVGMLDPNPIVNGNGLKKLREAGIEVEVGLLEREARRLNEAFEKSITKKLPLVVLKIAQSLDGKIALRNGRSKYITSQDSLKLVHELRACYDAVLVGAGTVREDNPELTVRLVEGRSPVRIVLDGVLSSPPDSRVFGGGRTIVFYASSLKKTAKVQAKINGLTAKGVELIPLRGDSSGRLSTRVVLKRIAELGIASVMVEGGADVFSQFIRPGMADKLHVFVAPKIMGSGKTFSDGIQLNRLTDAVEVDRMEIRQVGCDLMITGYFK